jgi:3-oxoacyl-[acyl-carrier protein] reductase
VVSDNRIVLVTGASRGIGRAVATRFAERGATVVVHYALNEVAAQETISGLPGTGHLAIAADLADADAVAALVAQVITARGRIDVLVNNAGIYEAHPVLSTSYGEWRQAWRRTLDTNLIGPANLIHEVVPHMAAQGGGRIVNVSSRGAFRGEPDCPAYGASKAGLNSLGQSLAQALARYGIYVTTVAPRRSERRRDPGAEPDAAGGYRRRSRPGGRLSRGTGSRDDHRCDCRRQRCFVLADVAGAHVTRSSETLSVAPGWAVDATRFP